MRRRGTADTGQPPEGQGLMSAPLDDNGEPIDHDDLAPFDDVDLVDPTEVEGDDA